MAPHLRIARPTDQLDELARMYELGLNLTRVGVFRSHDGFDGYRMVIQNASWEN